MRDGVVVVIPCVADNRGKIKETKKRDLVHSGLRI